MGRKPKSWNRIDRDYEQIRIHMQTLFDDLALTTPDAPSRLRMPHGRAAHIANKLSIGNPQAASRDGWWLVGATADRVGDITVPIAKIYEFTVDQVRHAQSQQAQPTDSASAGAFYRVNVMRRNPVMDDK